MNLKGRSLWRGSLTRRNLGRRCPRDECLRRRNLGRRSLRNGSSVLEVSGEEISRYKISGKGACETTSLSPESGNLVGRHTFQK